MGTINSNTSNRKYNYRFQTTSPSRRSMFSSCNQKNNHISIHEVYNKQRLCMKKKVLMLGLDGVGKTDLFTRLIQNNKQTLRRNSLPRPTIGYNVETIKLHCHHLCHRGCHKITLWDCGGESSVRSLWPYHFSNTSLILWLISVHDRSRLDTNLHLLSQILTNPLLNRVPVLIVLYHPSFDSSFDQKTMANDDNQNLLTNLEVAFRFLATLSTSRASTFKWQVISVNSEDDLKKLRQSFKEMMEL